MTEEKTKNCIYTEVKAKYIIRFNEKEYIFKFPVKDSIQELHAAITFMKAEVELALPKTENEEIETLEEQSLV